VPSPCSRFRAIGLWGFTVKGLRSRVLGILIQGVQSAAMCRVRYELAIRRRSCKQSEGLGVCCHWGFTWELARAAAMDGRSIN